MGNLDSFFEKKTPKTDSDGSYIDKLPTFPEVSPETELIELNGSTLRFRLMQTGLKKGERAAVSKAIGNIELQRGETDLYRVTVGDIRKATIDQLARLPDSGVRTAKILKKLVG